LYPLKSTLLSAVGNAKEVRDDVRGFNQPRQRSAHRRLIGLHADVCGSARGRRAAKGDRSIIRSVRWSGRFRREATGAAEVIANRFGADQVVVRFNTKTGGDATVEALAATLQAEAKKMNADRDILFLILTSHGSQEGLAVNAGRSAETLKPFNLAVMLKRTGIPYKVIVISACYPGVFIPPIADADTLVVTAADANHSSFGCEDKAKWTYFGDAFFNTALRQTSNLKEAFLLARSLVSKRELRQGFEPSHPQMAGGGNVEPLLVARR
jgi:peptidase C13-like protein